jgi:hypothetical protein
MFHHSASSSPITSLLLAFALALFGCGRMGYETIDAGLHIVSDAGAADAPAVLDAGEPPEDASTGPDASFVDPDAGGEPGLRVMVVPSHVGGRVLFDPGIAGVRIGGDATPIWVVDTSTGLVRTFSAMGEPSGVAARMAGPGLRDGIDFRLLTQPVGPALAVFVVDSLTIEPDGILVAAGPAALVVLARTEVSIAGMVFAGADRIPGAPGPAGANALSSDRGVGGGTSGSGWAGAAGGGGGGGCFGGEGGRGGSSGIWLGGGCGAVGVSHGLAPSYLRGGSAGGPGFSSGAPTEDDTRGGHGGGAIQITALDAIELLPGSVLDASGGGGRGRGPGGGGGGSGGMIVLEAQAVRIDGLVAANGGAGAGADDGQTGDALFVPALGGAGAPDVGAGGDGSDENGVARNGSNATWGGGGGGGAGVIRILTLLGTESYTGLSPSMASGLATVERVSLETL